MPGKPNAPIGRCPCPFKGHDHEVDVYRYQRRASSDTRRRHAGKLYVRCPEGGRAEPQDWILERMTWLEAAPADDGAHPADCPCEACHVDAPEPETEPARAGGFGFFR